MRIPSSGLVWRVNMFISLARNSMPWHPTIFPVHSYSTFDNVVCYATFSLIPTQCPKESIATLCPYSVPIGRGNQHTYTHTGMAPGDRHALSYVPIHMYMSPEFRPFRTLFVSGATLPSHPLYPCQKIVDLNWSLSSVCLFVCLFVCCRLHSILSSIPLGLTYQVMYCKADISKTKMEGETKQQAIFMYTPKLIPPQKN